MKKKWIVWGALFLTAAMALSLGTPIAATPVVTEWSEKTRGATTVKWTSSFHDLDYTLRDTILLRVEWDITAGVAQFESFGLKGKGFTPSSKKDPASGSWGIADQGVSWVEIDVTFDGLHRSEEELVDIGNAHFKLWLMVDEDGDGVLETLAGFGVNLHVEDPW